MWTSYENDSSWNHAINNFKKTMLKDLLMITVCKYTYIHLQAVITKWKAEGK